MKVKEISDFSLSPTCIIFIVGKQLISTNLFIIIFYEHHDSLNILLMGLGFFQGSRYFREGSVFRRGTYTDKWHDIRVSQSMVKTKRT